MFDLVLALVHAFEILMLPALLGICRFVPVTAAFFFVLFLLWAPRILLGMPEKEAGAKCAKQACQTLGQFPKASCRS